MDNNVKSYRKLYVRPVKANWWTQKGFYTLYMIREATSVLGLWVALELIILMLLPFLGIQSHSFLSNGLVILLNIVSLAAVLFHAFTWFNLMPKAVRMFTNGQPTNTKLIPPAAFITALWVGTAVASIVIAVVLIMNAQA